jgi:hypothetical protein
MPSVLMNILGIGYRRDRMGEVAAKLWAALVMNHSFPSIIECYLKQAEIKVIDTEDCFISNFSLLLCQKYTSR